MKLSVLEMWSYFENRVKNNWHEEQLPITYVPYRESKKK